MIGQNGEITFPVVTNDGTIHDIDDLSSGEKEVVFGYLRAKTHTPTDSIIMIDEPELHLNPGLIRGLAKFYQEGIGSGKRNQLWLVSHSDAFLRDAVRTGGMKVFHMEHCGYGEGNQLHPVDTDDEVERLFLEIVGDIATFKPTGPLIILEGNVGGTDKWIVEQLFPKLAEAATVVGAGGVMQLEKIAEVFDAIEKQRYRRRQVIAISDGDTTTRRGRKSANRRGRLKWDRYHIENYLLEEEYITRALKRLTRDEGIQYVTTGSVGVRLKEIARRLVDDFARERVEMDLRDGVRSASRLPGTTKQAAESGDIAELLAERTQEIAQLVSEYQASHGQATRIREKLEQEKTELLETLETEEWKKCFKGRDIIGRFVGEFGQGVPRDTFVTAIVREMQNDGYEPSGMRHVLEKTGLELTQERST